MVGQGADTVLGGLGVVGQGRAGGRGGGGGGWRGGAEGEGVKWCGVERRGGGRPDHPSLGPSPAPPVPPTNHFNYLNN